RGYNLRLYQVSLNDSSIVVLNRYPLSHFERLVGGKELGRSHICENVPVSNDYRNSSQEENQEEHVDRYVELVQGDNYSKDPDSPGSDLLKAGYKPGRNGPCSSVDDAPVKTDDQEGEEKGQDSIEDSDGEAARQKVVESWNSHSSRARPSL